MKKMIKRLIGGIIQLLFGHLKIVENKIFLETGTGEAKDQVRAIYNYIKANHPEEYEFIWALNPLADVEGLCNSEIVYKRTLSYYFHLLTSKYWMRTHSVETIVSKRKGQIYIQLWHGPGATKKEGFDIKGINNNGKVMPHAKEWDYFIATDTDNQRYIQTALNLQIPRLLLGSCRTDVLVNRNRDDYYKLRKKLDIKDTDKVVLYAPTFREIDFHKEKVSLHIKKLSKIENVRLILRLHPEIKNKLDIAEYAENIIDGNKYADIFDLYMLSDILVTDYSSVSIEYSLLMKPFLFYMYDLEEYTKERDFYYNYLDSLPGPIIKTEDELIYAISNIDSIMETYHDSYMTYYEKYNSLNDGNVCRRFYTMLKNGDFKQNN
jgi:similar to teichoic acid biosynthesis protein F